MIRIGVIGTANIAWTRMIPTILQNNRVEYVGLAVASIDEWDADAKTTGTESDARMESEKLYRERMELADKFKESFGGRIHNSYMELLEQPDIDAVYIPLPPSLHFKWARQALLAGKHVLLEKPFTLSVSDTEELLSLAKQKGLSVIENYGFPHHNQFIRIKELLNDGAIGDLRLIRTAFGFPHRSAGDFRYNKYFGGGALLDCGGYTLKLASLFLKDPIQVLAPNLIVTEGHEVDIHGSATLTDGDLSVQLAFGMDHAYKCELELWGSTGILTANRFYTAPDGLDVTLTIRNNDGIQEIPVPACNQFGKILDRFLDAIQDSQLAGNIRVEIRRQAQLVDQMKAKI